MSRIFVTSDTHFNHKNITGPKVSTWSQGFRGFDTIEQMNECMIGHINSVVGPEDVLWHVGDFAFGNVKEFPRFREAIKCNNIHLLYGNHDHQIRKDGMLRALFSSCGNYKQFSYNKHRFVLMHYPLHVWDGHQHGAIHLHGHCHGNLPPTERKREDVGIDCQPVPQTLDFYIDLTQKKKVCKVDHHDGDTD
jgi:calcineurin-like phosphoesterase family protein